MTCPEHEEITNSDRWQVVGADEELPQDVIEALVALAIESLRRRGELSGAPEDIDREISGMFKFTVEEAPTPSVRTTV